MNEFDGFIRKINYNPKFNLKKLDPYDFENFDINNSKRFGLLQMADNDFIAYAVWGTPKRTRTYPFSRLYDIYHTNTVKMAIIPIIKDEGGDTSNNDRINSITLSWMNLLNIRIILAYYTDAERKTGRKNLITNQILDNDYIKNKIIECSMKKGPAIHWNKYHFENDFVNTWNCAVENYKKISKEQKVRLHSSKGHINTLKKYTEDSDFLCFLSANVILRMFEEEAQSNWSTLPA